MTEALPGSASVWPAVVERFEQKAPASVMARLLLEQAFPARGVDDVFENHHGSQYERTLLFSTVVDLMMLVAMGLRPSLHAAARQSETLPVSLAALYDKIKGTEPDLLRALVRASAERLSPVMAQVSPRPARLAGYALRIIDGNHLPASEKRLKVLRGHPGAALPGQAIVVYDPDSGLVVDMVGGEDAYEGERALAAALLDQAGPGQVWIADRHFCPGSLLCGWDKVGAGFIVREHARHPSVSLESRWSEPVRIPTGWLREQTIMVAGQTTPWRRIELTLDQPTEAGESVLRIWSNLPARIDAAQIADLYRDRWCIEGMFQRLESVLQSEVTSLGYPRAALLAFAVALLAYNVLALIGCCVEQAHPAPAQEAGPVSLYHLAVDIRRGYEALTIALPGEQAILCAPTDPPDLAARLLNLARRINPKRLATSPRKPKDRRARHRTPAKDKTAHFATARILANQPQSP